MAIINKNSNSYYKIISSVTDYINQRTIINFEIYENKDRRISEKALLPQVHNFLNSAHAYITQMREEFEASVNVITPIDTIRNEEEFLSKNPELKILYNKLISLEQEYSILSTNLLNAIIDKNSLNNYNIWENLGLTDELLDTSIIKVQTSIGFDGVAINTREALYTNYKQIYDNFEDDLE